MGIRDEISEFAKSIGIEHIGFSDTSFEQRFIDRLVERRENNHLSGLEEQDENKRVDVAALLENAKTIISVALPYRNYEPYKGKPFLSKTALGTDYHRVLGQKLSHVSDFLKHNYDAQSVWFCDIGPLSDREIARKSGIGFYGKNSSIITETYGSFVFLGEIITDLYIERDAPIETKCGDCDLCMRACPAGAIEKPYYLNAKKCLSFLTQKKEDLTEDEMDRMGLCIYGCDICQEVCPHNRNARRSKHQEFIPPKWNIDINEEEFLNISNKDFKNTFGTTSSGWRGKNVLRRNLVVAMGNSRNRDYLPLLRKIKDDKLEYYIKRSIKKLEVDGDGKKG